MENTRYLSLSVPDRQPKPDAKPTWVSLLARVPLGAQPKTNSAANNAEVAEPASVSRLNEELLNMVSHEFKTPLATIMGFTGLLAKKNGGLSDEQRQRYLGTIARQAERLNTLVENLMTSAVEIERSVYSTADVSEIVEAVRAQLSDVYDDVRLIARCVPGLRARMNGEALRLVVANLANNALRHAAPRSVVVVEVIADGEDVVIAVTNEGDPISPAIRERIFEPFVQLDASGRTAEGVGLGLHIVRKVVAAYGGTVAVEGSGRTVTFTVRIPHAPAPARAP